MRVKLLILLMFLSFTANAASKASYQFIIDAGSSGSRIHLYKVLKQHADEKIDNRIDIVEIDIENNSVEPGLSAYAKEPQSAGQSIEPLLRVASEVIKSQHIAESVPISLFGTAGMRLVEPKQQEAIYSSVKKQINMNPAFLLGTAITLPGEKEALFDWLSVNIEQDNFNQSQPTVGALDLGGASFQVAYEAQDGNGLPIERVNINDKLYSVVVKSYLGLGVDQFALQLEENKYCYPRGFEDGAFDKSACIAQIENSLADLVSPRMHLPKDMKFVAFSNFFYITDFFTPKNSITLMNTISGGICENNWDFFKSAYLGIPDKYLSGYCFGGLYIASLLNTLLDLPENTNKISISKQDMSWSKGAALYLAQPQNRTS